MGCQCSAPNIQMNLHGASHHSHKDQMGKLMSLPKGGVVINTSIGKFQYGVPPESVKDSIANNFEVAEFFIIPNDQFDFISGMSLMELEFPVYYNFFFKRKKTTIICEDDMINKIKLIFQETLNGPKDLSNFKDDFVNNY